MKLQIKILFNNLKKLLNIHIIFYLSLVVYFFVYMVFRQYSHDYYNYIFGVINFQNHISILLLLLNISYLVIVIYKYLTFEIRNFPFQIVLRENSKNWFLQKSFTTILFILFFKFSQYLIFGTLDFIIFNILPFNIDFYLNNLLLFIVIGFIILAITCFKSPLKYTSIFLLMLYINRIHFLILISIMFVFYIILISNFKFKSILNKYKI